MKFLFKKKEYYIDGYLASQLDSLVYNLKEDWDFVVLITGDRMVRVGKSVLAQLVCAYLSVRISQYMKVDCSYGIDDVYFDSETMIHSAQSKPKYSINHYDEARETLASSKHMNRLQQDLIDFFNECGQLNHIFVLVLPDYFTLKEEVAVGRSELLLNVYRKEVKKMVDMYKEGQKIPVVDFKRGFFEFFGRKRKQSLYDRFSSSRNKNYFAVKANFLGNFQDRYPVDEEAYRKKKQEALKRFEEKKKIERIRPTDKIRDKIIQNLKREGLTNQKIADKLMEDYEYQVTPQHIGRIIDMARQSLGNQESELT